MSSTNLFIIKTLLLLWIVCVVLCEHKKRDVRIVLKQRIPRSQKKGHSHTHGHHHKRGNHYSGRNKGGHGPKKGKKHVNSYEKDSFEDESGESRENSFEEVVQKHHKGHKSNHHELKKPHNSPAYFLNQDFEESRQIPYKDYSKYMFQNEWIPLSSEQVHQTSHETYRDRHKRKRNSRNNYLTSLKPPPIDLTTAYPFQFESSSVFPQMIDYPGAFSNFNYNQKIIESNQSPLIGTIEHPIVQFSELKNDYNNRLNNHRASYEVTELTPSGSNTNTFVSVPDVSISDDSADEVTTKPSKNKKEEKSTKRPIRNRGRSPYKEQKKA